jgi:hypothetical protein
MNMKTAAKKLVAKPTPIEWWLDAVVSDCDGSVLRKGLIDVYECHPPTHGEIIFTGACAYSCKHCIYGPDFASANQSLPPATWQKLFSNMHADLGIETFVYGGRSISTPGIETLAALKHALPNAKVGVIDNGISYVPFREKLLNLKLDWIDISVDGQEQDHDEQRGKPGGYQETLQGAEWLLQNRAAPKINILSCLTSINQGSLIPMIRDLSAKGFPNFFITPIAFAEGIRPDPALRVSSADFARFVHELIDALPTFEDVWIELILPGADYLADILNSRNGMVKAFTAEGDNLVFHSSAESNLNRNVRNEFFIRYSPLSLTGTRELIVNTNGDVIVPKSVATGEVLREAMAGNLNSQSAIEIMRGIGFTDSFDFYVNELLKEQQLLSQFF